MPETFDEAFGFKNALPWALVGSVLGVLAFIALAANGHPASGLILFLGFAIIVFFSGVFAKYSNRIWYWVLGGLFSALHVMLALAVCGIQIPKTPAMAFVLPMTIIDGGAVLLSYYFTRKKFEGPIEPD